MFDKPVWHLIYRFCIYFAPQSTKDWAMGHRFIEWVQPLGGAACRLECHPPPSLCPPWCSLPIQVLESGKLYDGERWVLEGLMAIRGSRNGVFWADAIAIVIWRLRAIEFLQQQQKLAEAKKEKEGGATRRYLLAMLQEPWVIACLHAMALAYLQLYLPVMSQITHVDDVADELSQLDQAIYSRLVSAQVTPPSLLRDCHRLETLAHMHMNTDVHAITY